jgi:hypothetical protein
MTFLATPPKEERQQLQTLALTPGDPDAFKPGFFEGAGTATAVGLGRVGAIANQIVGEAEFQVSALFTRPLDDLLGTDMTGFLNQELRYEPQALTASMTPDPMTTGFAGQVLYSLVGVGVPAIAGGYFGGPAGAMATTAGFTGLGTYTDLTKQGVDPTTAVNAAALDAALMAAGVGLPAAIGGKVALNTLLYGPGINVGQSLIAGQGNAAWLESRGYGEIAERYATYDAQMLAADVVLGAAFGWAGARGARAPRGTIPKPQTGDVDAALTALDQRHVEVDTAPGLPADIAAARSHLANLTRATEQLLAGQPVETAGLNGSFVPKPPPRDEFADGALFRALEESGYFETAAEVRQLEAELAARGRVVVEEPLPDLAAAMDRIERDGGQVGRVTDVKIGDEYAAARWTVMEADAVAPSVAVSENQLRDRTRAASELQVNAIAANLDPKLLLSDFPTMDVGAPTLTADGKVVAGNGRALAIRKAYEGERGQAYREALLERAQALGLDPAAVAGMQRPVLVRVLQQAVDVERAAIASNESGAARMSNLEQARVDAGRLPSMAAMELPDSGDFTAASAAPFVRGWLQQFPETQLGALVGADGKLSQEGLTRLRNAVLFRAYGDSDTLQRLVESTDPGSRNVATGLVRAAPKVAEVKDAIARGELHPLDLSDAVVRTADLIEQIRDQGLTVDNWIAQLDLFNPGETPTTLALLRFVDANKRSARAITDLLTGYYDDVIAAGSPKQGDMLGAEKPDATTLLSNAIARSDPDDGAKIVQDTLFRPEKAPVPTTPEAALRGAEAQVGPWGMPAPARTIPDGDPLLQDRSGDTSPERVALREALVEQRFAGKAPAAGVGQVATFEGEKPAAPGSVVRVLRVAGEGENTLAGRNAANVDGMVNFLAEVDDFDSSINAPKGAVLQVWEYTVPEKTGGYAALMNGKQRTDGKAVDADHYGRGREYGGAGSAWYSFGSAVAGQARMVGAVPLDAVRKAKGGAGAFDGTAAETAWLQSFVDGKFPAQGKRPVAIVLGGGGASGKGTIKGRLRAMGVFDDNYVDLDPDSFKTGDKKKKWGGLPEYWQIVKQGDSRAAAVVHEESSAVYKMAAERAVAGKFNVVLDRTLGDPAKGLAELQRLKAAGYEIKLVGVTVEPATAVKRAVERATGPEKRFVPIDQLLKAHKGFAQAWEQYAALADAAVLYDNEVPKGAEAKPLAGRAPNGILTIVDEKAYSGFARKGGLNEKARDENELYGPEAEGLESARGDHPGADGGSRRGDGSGRAGADRGGDGAGDLPGGGLDPAPVLAERPDLTIVDDTGRTAYAADKLAEADHAVARAEVDALGFDAAVNCFLRSAA